MSKTRNYRIVSELVAEALDLPTEERGAFLDRECPDDPALRREVESLLAEDQKSRAGGMAIGGIIEAARLHAIDEARREESDALARSRDRVDSEAELGTETEPLDTRSGRLPAPSRIGPFRVVDVLGEGGMGVVYLAEQTEPIERRLALKLIHTSLRSPKALLRFEAERQAMARLSHPHIAQMIEAGTTEEGFPYFAMELLRDAVPLTDYCDREKLPIDERLRLFAQVCRAVHHAHQRGILHRDIKPANVLVVEGDAGPIPKVIDFGLAKALDRPLTSEPELTGRQVIGTMAYLSPEAFAVGEWDGEDGDRGADVDTRADVYALGVILYELLCGRLPFRRSSSGLGVLIERKVKEEATPPSARLDSSFGSPDSEIAERRRLSVIELSRRLSTDLDWVVLKAVARNRDERYSSANALAEDVERYLRDEPLEAHPPTASYRLRKLILRHRGPFLAGAAIVLTLVLGSIGTTVGMIRANQEAEKAQQALSESEELTRFLTDLFNAADPTLARDQNAQELLDRGADQIESRFQEQPRVRSRILQKIANLYITLGVYDRARPLLEEARQLTDAVFSGALLEDAAVAIIESRLALHTSHYAEAAERAGHALEIRQGLLGDQAELTLAAKSMLARCLLALDRSEDAERMARELLATRLRLHGADSEPVAGALALLGKTLLELGQWQEALEHFEEELRILESALGPDHHRSMAAVFDLARIYHRLGRSEEAEAAYDAAVAAAIETFGEEHDTVASRLQSLAIFHRGRERPEKAEDLHLRSIEIWQAIHGPDSLKVARGLNNLGSLYWERERYEEARTVLERALAIKEKSLPPGHSELGHPITNLGLIYWKQGDLGKAEAYLERAAKLWEESLPRDHAALGWPLWGLAGVHRDQGRFEEAEPLYRRALEIRERYLTPDHRQLRKTRADYALMLRSMGREEEARSMEAENESADG